jgi:dihydropyrimidine dehydrogenase (NAD+) subunit PreA
MRQDPELVRRSTENAKQSGLPIAVNLLCGDNVDLWVQGVKAAEQGGADLLELNLSCPAPLMGFDVSKDLGKTTEIVKAVRGSTGLPIMAKIHACLMEDELKRLAVTVVEAGVNAISTTNLFYGIVGVDIETGMPVATESDVWGNPRAGVAAFSGPSIKPFGLRAVAEIASAVDVPISGIGGVTSWQSAVEYMMLGASTVQVGMAAMLFGYDMVNDMISGLSGFMERKGYRSPNDFIGVAFRNVPGLGEKVYAPLKLGRRYVVDDALCNGCGLCVKTCSTSNNGAMQLRKDTAWIDSTLCNCCGMCRIVCPIEAILAEQLS